MAVTPDLDWAVHVRPYPGAPRGGDWGAVIPADDGALAVLVDAAGHGLTAYVVAQKVRASIYEHKGARLDALLLAIDQSLKNTDGAAISLAFLSDSHLCFVGVGNIQASVGGRPLVSRAGIVGLRMRQPRLIETRLEPGAWFLMHSDGVSSPTSIPAGSAQSVAASLVEKFGSFHDDASVLLLRRRETGA